MKQLIQFIKKLFKYQFVRFLIAGGINTLFSYSIFALLLFVLKNKYIATTLETIIAIAFNYFTSSHMVFKNKTFSLFMIIKFYGIYGVTYLINLLHLHITVDIYGWNEYLSQFVTLLYLPFISFTLQRLFVFKNSGNKPTDELKDKDDVKYEQQD